jgi:hypothetical protein
MISDTLKEISTWYGEPATSADRPTLLSKLAVLELCGWIECELDRLILVAETGRLNDPNWVSGNIISPTYGFNYTKHFRPMLVRVAGEIYARRIEAELERRSPGDLDRLRNLLVQLWDLRCKMAHLHVGAVVPQQISYQAPTMSASQHKDVARLLGIYEQAMVTALAQI